MQVGDERDPHYCMKSRKITLISADLAAVEERAELENAGGNCPVSANLA
jgi:hypothetical protein